MAEIDLDAMLIAAGFMKMKPIPVEVEVLDLTSTKNRVFVKWDEAELLADGPTLKDAMSDFVDSLIHLCTALSSPNATLHADPQRIKKISEYIRRVTTEGLLA